MNIVRKEWHYYCFFMEKVDQYTTRRRKIIYRSNSDVITAKDIEEFSTIANIVNWYYIGFGKEVMDKHLENLGDENKYFLMQTQGFFDKDLVSCF